jgi:hypothetical protein
MDDVWSLAVTLLRGPCCIAEKEPTPTAVGLIRRYVDGETWDDPEVLSQLSRCLSFAHAEASGPEAATGPGRDAQHFYSRAATILQGIYAEVSAGPK